MAITKVRSYRLDEDIINQLSVISSAYNLNDSDVIKRLINNEYLKISGIGEDKIKKINDQLTYVITHLSDFILENNI